MRDVATMTTIATSAIVITIVIVIMTMIVIATNSVARPRLGGAAGTLDSALTGLVRATVMIMTITRFVAAMATTTGNYSLFLHRILHILHPLIHHASHPSYKNYRNECYASAASVSVDKDGKC